MRASFDPYGAASPAIDQQLGDAFQVVRFVARHIPEIASVAYHMEALYTLASAGGKANADLLGLPNDAKDLGEFEGDLLPDALTVKSALQLIATYVVNLKESVDTSFNNQGNFTGTTLPDNASLHTVLQAIETALEQIYAKAPVLASQTEAEAGSDNQKVMSPLRVKQAINNQVPAVAMGDSSNEILSDDGTVKEWFDETITAVLERPTATELLMPEASGIIGADDNSGGTLWTNIQGFINYLATSVGSSILGFIQTGSGAVLRSVQAKLRDSVSVRDYGALGDGATNDYDAFVAAIATGKTIYVPRGTYRINTPLDLTHVILIGDGVEYSRIECNSPTATDPVIHAGGNTCIRNIEIGFAAARLTGAEVAGERAGIRPYSPTSGLPLQRGALISNIRIRLVGTGIYDPPGTGPATYFSVTFDGIEIRDFTYRGWDAQSSIRTGNRYDNIYINQAGGPYLTSNNVDAGFLLGGEESEASFGQINVEWLKAGQAIGLFGVRGIAGGSFHIEQFTQRNNYAAAFVVDKSSGYIDALTAYYCPIVTAGWWLLRLRDSTYDGATVNPTSCNFIRIGTLHVKGLNDGPQVVGGTGLTGLTHFAFTDREVGAVGTYYLQIDSYVWNTYKTDQAVYQAFPNDPHSLIKCIATVAGPPIGKDTSATGYVRRPDGLIEMWGPIAAVAANTTVTINFPTIPGEAVAGFPNGCLSVHAEPDDVGTTDDYRYNASQKTASNFKVTNTAAAAITGFWRAVGF